MQSEIKKTPCSQPLENMLNGADVFNCGYLLCVFKKCDIVISVL